MISPCFDWYAASLQKGADFIIDGLMEDLPDGLNLTARSVKGVPQYERSVGIFSDEDLLCDVSFGGNRDAPPHVRSRGWSADIVAPVLRNLCPEHRVSRVDSCCDLSSPEIFDLIYQRMSLIYSQKGIYRRSFGFAAPENGRTFYLGSPKSPVQVRLYEKGKKLINEGVDADPNWVRLEIEVRPLTHEKSRYSGFSPAQVWGSSPWASELFKLVTDVQPCQIKRMRVQEKSLWDRAMLMIDQNKRFLMELRSSLTDDEFIALIDKGIGRPVDALLVQSINNKLTDNVSAKMKA